MRTIFRLGVTASLLSAGIYADEMTTLPERPRLPSDVFLESPDYTFTTYFNALIMQPTSSNLQYTTEVFSTAAPLGFISTPHWNTFEIHTDYQFGFDVGIGYVFHNANSGLTLNWEHFHSDDSDSEPDTSDSDVYTPFFDLNIGISDFQQVYGKNKFWFDEANLNYGTFVNLGNHLKLNLFSGVSFARIKQTFFSRFNSLVATNLLKITTPSTFTGAGPQLGLNFTQNIIKGFNFNGKIAGALIIGPQSTHTTYSTTTTTGVITQKLKPENKVQLVPNMEGNLGLAYLFTFCKHYMVNLEAGYRAQVYIDSIQTTDAGVQEVAIGRIRLSAGPSSISPNSLTQTISNFSLAGPYVMLNIGF